MQPSTSTSDPFDLARFAWAHEGTYEHASRRGTPDFTRILRNCFHLLCSKGKVGADHPMSRAYVYR